MKFYFTAAYAWSFLLSRALSELRMTVLLNNGVLPTPEGYSCNAKDTILIQDAIDDDDYKRRSLKMSTEAIVYEDYHRRSLKTRRQCRDDCRGQASGSCHEAECKGFRRQLETDQRKNRLSGDRKLGNDAQCSVGAKFLNRQLDSLLPQLSTGCRPVVQFNRTVTCFDDVRYAAIEGFNMWNANTDTVVLTNIQNATTFCFTNSNLNIETVANACVEKVEMTLTGPVSESGKSKDTAPYTIFGFEKDN